MTTPAPIPFDLQFAMDSIRRLYGHKVNINTAEPLDKWGSRFDVSTIEVTVSDFEGEAHETLLTTNGITHAISTDAAATQTLEIRGNTISSGVLTASRQTLILDGQTAVALNPPIGRFNRSWNDTATPLDGNVSFYEGGATSGGVVTNKAEIHGMILQDDDDQTEKCATSMSNGIYWIIKEFGGSILSKNAASIDLKLQTRKKDKLFRPLGGRIGLSTNGTTTDKRKGPFIITPNSDTRVTAKATTGSNIAVEAYMRGYIVQIVSP